MRLNLSVVPTLPQIAMMFFFLLFLASIYVRLRVIGPHVALRKCTCVQLTYVFTYEHNTMLLFAFPHNWVIIA